LNLYFRDKDLQAFADFWRPIVTLDGSLWYEKFFFFLFNHFSLSIGNVLCIHII
jgi:hypothetical protein